MPTARPATHRSPRTLALPAQLTEALREQAKQQAKERVYVEELWEDHGLFFAQENGRLEGL